MALTDSLVAYWSLDETSGNAADSSGNGRTITAVNAPGTGAGKLGNGRTFVTASNQHFDITAASLGGPFSSAAAWTMAGWFLPTDDASFLEVVGQFDGSLQGPFLRREGTGSQQFRVQWFNNGSTSFSVNSGVSATSAGWHYVVAWYDGATTLGISVDNESAKTTTLSGTFNAPTCKFALGNRAGADGLFLSAGGGSGGWAGTIDAFGIWSRALSSTERTTLYNGGAGLEYPWATGAPLPLILAAHAAVGWR